MTRIINICKGWGCGLAPHCRKYRYVPESERRAAWVKEFIPTSPGANCPEFENIPPRRWGDGPEPND